jgi:hypothetical protein
MLRRFLGSFAPLGVKWNHGQYPYIFTKHTLGFGCDHHGYSRRLLDPRSSEYHQQRFDQREQLFERHGWGRRNGRCWRNGRRWRRKQWPESARMPKSRRHLPRRWTMRPSRRHGCRDESRGMFLRRRPCRMLRSQSSRHESSDVRRCGRYLRSDWRMSGRWRLFHVGYWRLRHGRVLHVLRSAYAMWRSND